MNAPTALLPSLNFVYMHILPLAQLPSYPVAQYEFRPDSRKEIMQFARFTHIFHYLIKEFFNLYLLQNRSE